MYSLAVRVGNRVVLATFVYSSIDVRVKIAIVDYSSIELVCFTIDNRTSRYLS